MAERNTDEGISAADAEHDDKALREAEEKMLMRTGQDGAPDGRDLANDEHDEDAMREAEEKMLLHTDHTDHR